MIEVSSINDLKDKNRTDYLEMAMPIQNTSTPSNGTQINECCICLQNIEDDSFTVRCEQSFVGTRKCANHVYHKTCLQTYVMNGNSCCPQDKIQFTHAEKKDLLLDGCLSDLLIKEVRPDSISICPYEMYRRRLQFDQFMHNASYIIENTDITISNIF